MPSARTRISTWGLWLCVAGGLLAWPTKIVTAKIEVLARDSGTSQ